ncbi:MAG: hypothetical protein NTW59_04045 [Candidatus Diapherotrites archaeon]|nr:hypothetical protein [Candidatus Diapherotrites archaeon]
MLVATTQLRRAPNFAEPKQWRCLNCGKELQKYNDLYSRRFCSENCRNTFFAADKGK